MSKLTDDDKEFILSFEIGEPKRELFPITVLTDLPAIQWKLININELKKSNPNKHNTMIEKLKDVLS